MTASKPWYTSLTVWAGILSMLSGLGLAGIQIDPATGDFHGNIYELWGSLSGIAFGLATALGRIRASTRLRRK